MKFDIGQAAVVLFCIEVVIVLTGIAAVAAFIYWVVL